LFSYTVTSLLFPTKEKYHYKENKSSQITITPLILQHWPHKKEEEEEMRHQTIVVWFFLLKYMRIYMIYLPHGALVFYLKGKNQASSDCQ